MPGSGKTTTVDLIFMDMLKRIETGRWQAGAPIPSERRLMEEYGVSRISIRDALSRMRALGMMHIAHGKKTVVEKMDARMLGRIFPVLLSLDNEQNCLHFLQLRITLENTAAFSAALNRTPDDVVMLEKLLRETIDSTRHGMSEEAIERDYAFHIGIAQACKNPLFPMLLEALAVYLAPNQVSSFRWDNADLELLNTYHTAIFEAIRDGNPEAARRNMENHLQASAGQIVSDGIWRRTGGRDGHGQLSAAASQAHRRKP